MSSYVVKKDDKLFLYNKEDKEFLLDENTIVKKYQNQIEILVEKLISTK